MRLENEYISAEFSLENAEVISFKKKENDYEIMWNRDPKVWANNNPILFPWISKGWGPEYQYDGKNYKMGNHGFARHSLFKCVKENENEVELELQDNEELYNNEYPFHFRLTVNYSLEGKKLWLKYKVENKDNKPMPFMLGFHPAFMVPMTKDSKYEDYFIRFEKVERLSETIMHNAPDEGYGTTNLLSDHTKIPFNGLGSVFFSNPTSEYVEMTDGKDGIRVGMKNFRRIGFWKKSPEAPFICLEPQVGCGYNGTNNNDLPSNDIVSLPSGKSYETSYYWEVL